MAKFGIQRSRPRLGFTPSTATPLNIDVRGTGGTGAAVGQALLAGADLYKQYDLQQANTQLSESQRKAQAELNDFKIRMKGNLDPDTYQADYEQTLERISQHAPKNKRGAQAYNLWVGSQAPKWQMGVTTAQMARADDNWQTEMSANIAAVASGTDPDAIDRAERMIARRQLGPNPLDKSDAAKLLSKARQSQVEGELANLKKAGMGGDVEAFDQARELVNQTNIFSSEESLAELKGIDMMEQFARKKSEDLKFSRNMDINTAFVEQISQGNLTPDMIAQSKLDDGSILPSLDAKPGEVVNKAKWTQWAEDSYQPAPTETTPDGNAVITNTLLDFSKFKLNKEQAYDELLTARYSDRSITDSEFQTAIAQLETPYPKQVVNDMEAIMKANDKELRFFRTGKKKDDARVNTANAELRTWVNSEIAQGRVPTQDQMYTQSAVIKSDEPAVELKPLSAEEESRRQELLKKKAQ